MIYSNKHRVNLVIYQQKNIKKKIIIRTVYKASITPSNVTNFDFGKLSCSSKTKRMALAPAARALEN